MDQCSAVISWMIFACNQYTDVLIADELRVTFAAQDSRVAVAFSPQISAKVRREIRSHAGMLPCKLIGLDQSCLDIISTPVIFEHSDLQPVSMLLAVFGVVQDRVWPQRATRH